MEDNIFSAEFMSVVSDLFKPELVTKIRKENEEILEALEKAGLNYMEVHQLITYRFIPGPRSIKLFIQTLAGIIERSENKDTALPVPPFPYVPIIETLDMINDLLKSPFVSEKGREALKTEWVSIHEKFDVISNIKKLNNALAEYQDRLNKDITTERYAIGEVIKLMDDYFREDLCKELKQIQSFGLIADFLNSEPQLVNEINGGEDFNEKRIKDLHDNYKRKYG